VDSAISLRVSGPLVSLLTTSTTSNPPPNRLPRALGPKRMRQKASHPPSVAVLHPCRTSDTSHFYTLHTSTLHTSYALQTRFITHPKASKVSKLVKITRSTTTAVLHPLPHSTHFFTLYNFKPALPHSYAILHVKIHSKDASKPQNPSPHSPPR
jgi:hypothetical protein